MDSSYIYKFRYKKNTVFPIDTPVLFLIGGKTTRKQVVDSIKEYDDDIDLRTMSLVQEIPATCDGVHALYDLLENV